MPATACAAGAADGWGLFHRVTERVRIVSHPHIAAHDSDQLRRLSQLLCARQVNRIQRPDRLHRVRPACPEEHGLGHGDDVAATPERTEPANGRALLLEAYPSTDSRAYEAAGGLSESECRGDATTPASEGRPRREILLQQGCEQRAGFYVAERLTRFGCSRGGRRARAADPATFPTARHDRHRSAEQLSRSECRCVANLPAADRVPQPV